MLQRLRRPRHIALQELLEEPGAAVALLDAQGLVLRASDPFWALVGAIFVLTEPASAALRAALQAKRPLTLEATIQNGPVALSLAFTGLRTPACVLRLVDLRPRGLLLAQLAQAQRLQAVGQLTAGIAHDFNNLLTAILGAADALGPELPVGAQQDLAVITTSASRGAALVRQLLAFGGQQTLQPRVLNLNDAVRASAALLGRVIGGHIKLVLALDEPSRMVCIDPAQLDQVLLNLAVNARDAMPQGGTLTLATGRRLVLSPEREDGTMVAPGRYATLDVCDTGGGIPPDVLPHVFEPFFTTKRDSGGTGLGLSSVHGIVRQSGGTLSVRSVKGEGTRFRITLPRYEAPLAAAPRVQPPHTAPPPALAGARLLLVDDEAPIRRLAARALVKAGWEVLEAASAEEALELDTGDVGLVISDVMMPGMDGPALVRALRQGRPDLKAILVSGYAGEVQRKALQAENIRFLAKPFAMATLVDLAGLCPEESASF